jgi:sulfate adenylyltransferase
VEDVYAPDLVKEAIQVFGDDDPAHPSVAYLRNKVKELYVGGKVQAIQLPYHFDYVSLRCKWTFYLDLGSQALIVPSIRHAS